jgi:H+/Cl- antiporter ClcA
VNAPAESAGGQPPAVSQSGVAKLLVLSVIVGVIAAAAGSVLMEIIHVGENWLYEDLPGALGFDVAPWWLAAIVLVAGASVVALARRLPGETGQGPLTGFHFDDPLRIVPSVLLAAIGTLCFGFVLGPEAPLIVLGTTIGLLLTRGSDPKAQQAAMVLGGVAAIGSIFGNPFISGFLMLEFAAFGLIPAVLIPGVLTALAAGYLTQVGIGNLPGFGVHPLAVPGVPAYETIEPIDLLVAVLVSVIAAVVIVIVREGAVAIDRTAQRRPIPILYAATAVTIVMLLIAEVGFGLDPSMILFSGQSAMADLVAETSVGLVVVIILTKAVAYAVALGGGFRGGPIFPATYLGVGFGLLVALLLPSVSVSPLAAAGIAAAAAAMIKAPGTSALLGALLIGGSGAAIAPFAIFGAVIGLVVRIAADRRLGVKSVQATTPTEPQRAAGTS